jgi:ketosteroid isomerase-like protein
MRGGTVVDVALRFVEAICSHDVERILELVTDDHVLIDSGGQELQGQKLVGVAWTAYFLAFPDYRIVVSEILEQGSSVALFGTAAATFSVEGKLLPENSWAIPACFKASIRDGKVAEWQVYADNEPVRQILASEE